MDETEWLRQENARLRAHIESLHVSNQELQEDLGRTQWRARMLWDMYCDAEQQVIQNNRKTK